MFDRPHTHDFERDREELTEEILRWTFERSGFTKPRETESAPAPVIFLPQPGRARRHLTLIQGGRK